MWHNFERTRRFCLGNWLKHMFPFTKVCTKSLKEVSKTVSIQILISKSQSVYKTTFALALVSLYSFGKIAQDYYRILQRTDYYYYCHGTIVCIDIMKFCTRLIPCHVLLKLTIIQLNLTCTLLVIASQTYSVLNSSLTICLCY